MLLILHARADTNSQRAGHELRGLLPRINLRVDESRDFGRLVPCSRSSHACQNIVFHKVAGNGGPVDRWRWLCCSAQPRMFDLPAPAVSSRIVSSQGGGGPETPFRAVDVSERAKLCRREHGRWKRERDSRIHPSWNLNLSQTRCQRASPWSMLVILQ